MDKTNKKKKSKKLKLSKKNLIIIIIAVIVIIALVIVLIYHNTHTLKTDSKEVLKLYDYLGSNDLEMCNGLIVYGEKKITSSDLENETKICLAYTLLGEDDSTSLKIDKSKKNNTCTMDGDIVFATDDYEEEVCTITKIDATKVNEKYKEMYGTEIENYIPFQMNNTTICFYSEEGTYYCGLSETYTYTIGAEPHTYRSMSKVTKSGNELIIYDYILKIINDECYTSYTGSTKNDNCSKNYVASEDLSYSFIKKYGTKYKHIYKKDGKDYHWVSSEPVK